MNRRIPMAGLAALILISLFGCLPTLPLLPISAAENIRQTTDGRVFVTGADALFEIMNNNGSETLQAVAISGTVESENPECRYYAGLAELNQWLFFVCAKQSGLNLKTLKFEEAGILKAYSLIDGQLVDVMPLSGYQFPNGIDAYPQENAILIADEDFILANGGVSKATLDFSSGKPVLLHYEHQWIGPQHEVFAANGVRVLNESIFVTDIGYLKQIDLTPEGTPTKAINRFKNLTVLDDFDVFCDGFLVTDFVKGRLVYVPMEGEAVITASGLTSPSAVLARSTKFTESNTILVTESRGLSANKGNQLLSISTHSLGIPDCE